MTNFTLADDYLKRAKIRMVALKALRDAGGYADVVREAQELVELVLKAALRRGGIEPPHWHDVGSILEDNAPKLTSDFRAHLVRIRALSSRLRKERELAYYGDEDYLPSQNYTLEDANQAIEDCEWLLSLK